MKSKLYTRTGDAGHTSLVDGTRAPKDCVRIEAYGDIDELSSTLGVVAACKDCPEEVKGQITQIQNFMFSLGGYLATPVEPGTEPRLQDADKEIERLEGWIDVIDEQTPPLKNFVLPGGCEGSARCHVARTVCRRAERHIVALQKESYVDPEVAAYVNRLSDYLFAVARYLNFLAGIEDVAWQR